MLMLRRPEVIGKNYLVLGTVERKFWQKHLENPSQMEETLKHTADFKDVYEIKFTPAGWYKE